MTEPEYPRISTAVDFLFGLVVVSYLGVALASGGHAVGRLTLRLYALPPPHGFEQHFACAFFGLLTLIGAIGLCLHTLPAICKGIVYVGRKVRRP